MRSRLDDAGALDQDMCTLCMDGSIGTATMILLSWLDPVSKYSLHANVL